MTLVQYPAYQLPQPSVMQKVFHQASKVAERGRHRADPAARAYLARASTLGLAASVRDILTGYDHQASFDAAALELHLNHQTGIVTAPGTYWTATGERRRIEDPHALFSMGQWTDGIDGGNREGWEPLCSVSESPEGITMAYRLNLMAAAELPQPGTLPDPEYAAATVPVVLPRQFVVAYEDEFGEIHQTSEVAVSKRVRDLMMNRTSRQRAQVTRYLLGHLADTAQTLQFLTKHAELHPSTRRARQRGCAALLDALATGYGIRPWPQLGHEVRPFGYAAHCEDCAALVGCHPPGIVYRLNLAPADAAARGPWAVEERAANRHGGIVIAADPDAEHTAFAVSDADGTRVGEIPVNSGPREAGTPAEQTPQEPARAVEKAAPEAPATQAPAEPAQDWRRDWRWQEAAKNLGWSTKHAAAVRAAVDGHLVRDADGTPRLVARPGLGGTPIAAGRLVPLEAAGYLVHGDADDNGRRPIQATDDARHALKLWDHIQPAPVERLRKKEHLPLQPMMYGEEWTRRAETFRAEQAEHAVERERFYAELDARHATEALEDRCWDAWARVQGITYRLGHRIPKGWAPTDEETQRHRLDPEIVALLRQRAAEHGQAEADAATAVEESQQAAELVEQGEMWDGAPGVVAGPGVVQPGMHVEYLPPFRPGSRTRHCHGGTIVSVGTTNVRWRPYKWHQDVRTPLQHMRIDPTMHVSQRQQVHHVAAALNTGRGLPKHPDWCVWSLAEHLAYAAAQTAVEPAEAAVEEAPAAAPQRLLIMRCCTSTLPTRSALRSSHGRHHYEQESCPAVGNRARSTPGWPGRLQGRLQPDAQEPHRMRPRLLRHRG